MKNKRSLLLVVVLVVIAVALLAYFYNKDKAAPKINWSQHYNPHLKEPYGLLVLSELLKTYHPDKKFEVSKQPISENSLFSTSKAPSNYVFIGNSFTLNEKDIDSLCAYASRGNTVFIASHDICPELISRLYHDECGTWEGFSGNVDSVMSMNFYNPLFYDSSYYRFEFRFRNKLESCSWNYIHGQYFCDSANTFEYLAFADSFYVNYMKVPYGSGNFLLHSSPLVFTNYQLLHKHNLSYAGKIFSYLNKGEIYWDEYYNDAYNYYDSSNNNSHEQSPLQYILDQPALRWSWYLLLALAFIYILFHAKRKQRVIRVLESKSNTSLAYIQTLGRLYFQQNEPKKISIKIMKNFLFYIRSRYGIATNVQDEMLVQKISAKSGIAASHIQKIFNASKLLLVGHYPFSNDDLLEFHQSIDYFYKNCK